MVASNGDSFKWFQNNCSFRIPKCIVYVVACLMSNITEKQNIKPVVLLYYGAKPFDWLSAELVLTV